MSGLEAIGVALGMFPVLTQTITMYKALKTARPANSLLRKLKTEKMIFLEFVRHILASEVGEVELRELTENKPETMIAKWQDFKLQEKLANKLEHEKAALVSETVEEICNILKSLQKDLADIPTGEKLLTEKIKTTERIMATIRAAKANMNQANIQDRLKLLNGYNEDLRRLLKHQGGIIRTGAGKTEFLHRDCQEPSELYEAISQSYTCSCDEPHIANLGFRCPCCDAPPGKSQKKGDEWHFELVVPSSYGHALRQHDLSDQTDATRITSNRVWTESPTSLHSSPERYPSNDTKDVNPIRGKCCSSSISLSLESRVPQGDPAPLVEDICSFVESIKAIEGHTGQALGVLQRKKTKYKVCINQTAPRDTGDMVSLESLLNSSESPSVSRRQLQRKDRMLLAFRLSRAVLQLSSTPWLDESWSWKNFSVLMVEKGEHDEQKRLYVQSFFYSAQAPPSRDTTPKQFGDFVSSWGEPVLTRLGFALIELVLGRTLAAIRQQEFPQLSSETADKASLDLRTAFEVLKQRSIARAESQVYQDVVEACLRRSYWDRRNSVIKCLESEDESFFDNVEESIIMPLYDACCHSGWDNKQIAVF